MPLSRRTFLQLAGATSLTAALDGCSQSAQRTTSRSRLRSPARPARISAQPSASSYTTSPATPPSSGAAHHLTVLPRSKWTTSSINTANADPMNGVSRLTVHHDGMEGLIWSDDIATSRQRLETIRVSHVHRGFADIGYHYVIDRAGRIWEARPIQYQGAHAGGANNLHNVGVLVMGNFDLQQPTPQQLQTLPPALRQLMSFYRVPVSRVYTHQELKPTACPGRNLQARMVQLRNGSYLL